MSDGPRYTMRASTYREEDGGLYAYAMILDRWYCYREVWRITAGMGGSGQASRENIVHNAAVAKLGELEAEHEAWLAAV